MMLCKGQKVDKKDIQNLKDVFEYFDIKFGDDYPSLINDKLIDYPRLLEDYFADSIKIDGINPRLRLYGIGNDNLSIQTKIMDNYDNEIFYSLKNKPNIEKESMCFKNVFNALSLTKDDIEKNKNNLLDSIDKSLMI